MDKPVQLREVTNVERLIVADQLALLGEQETEDYAVAMAGNLLKAMTNREKMMFALIEYLINSGHKKAAARVLCGLGLIGSSIRFKTTELNDKNAVQLNDSARSAIRDRFAGADMGVELNDVAEILGDLPDF